VEQHIEPGGDRAVLARLEPCAALLSRAELQAMATALEKPVGWVDQMIWNATMDPAIQLAARRALIDLSA
jgi:hypothetical protein